MSEFHTALDTSVSGLKTLIQGSLKFTLARDALTATKRDWWLATSKAVQSLIVERMIATATLHNNDNAKRVYYLSLEFLMGRLFSNNLYSAGVNDDMVHALEELGLDYEELRHEEYDMGLGNGGLGRLASCFLDSLATLDFPAIGYGIHYQYGLFKQEFRNGYQVELPDAWMQYGTPWEIVRPEQATEIQVYGYVENVFDDRGNYVPRWMGWKKLVGLPYDIPVPGYGTNTVNFLRLWESRAPEEFDFEAFNRGGYEEAVREKNHSETISKVLYPNDKTDSGKELRLLQQYFFVACSLKDIIRRFRRSNEDWDDFPEKVAIQLNDTHPAIAVVVSSASCMMNTGCPGMRHGRSCGAPSHTPITPCCPKRLRSGVWGSSRRCYPGTCRSSLRSISAFWKKWKRSGQGTLPKSKNSPLLRKATPRWCAWRIFQWPAAIRSGRAPYRAAQEGPLPGF
jgi:glycogen phosphorylase